MVLELGKTLSFFLSILSLYPVAMSAFFEPSARWEDRLILALPKVAIAASVCLASGLLFSWPSRTNPGANRPLASTLPVRLFLCAIPAIAALFVLGWYLVCGGSGCPGQSEAWM
jgi:hypothetical protein